MILTINPIALSFGPLTVTWYALIIMGGLLLGAYIAIKEGKRFGIEPDFFYDLILYGLPISIVCARIYYVVFYPGTYYQDNPMKVFAVWEGGIAIHGALIGAFLTGFFYSKRKGVSYLRVTDLASVSFLIAQAIGRWGNFMNHEAHGGETTRSFLEKTLRLPDFIVANMHIGGVYYHPTFLYESVWNLIGFLILIFTRRSKRIELGDLTLLYFIWYSIGRLYIESLRTDSLYIFGTVRVAQFISIIMIVGGIVLLILKRKFNLGKYND